MRRYVKKTIEVQEGECDFCGNEVKDLSYLYKCDICGKDFCRECGNVYHESICNKCGELSEKYEEEIDELNDIMNNEIVTIENSYESEFEILEERRNENIESVEEHYEEKIKELEDKWKAEAKEKANGII